MIRERTDVRQLQHTALRFRRTVRFLCYENSLAEKFVRSLVVIKGVTRGVLLGGTPLEFFLGPLSKNVFNPRLKSRDPS